MEIRHVWDGGAAGAPQDEFCRELGTGVGDPLPTSSVVLLAARAALRFARMAASLSPSSAMSFKVPENDLDGKSTKLAARIHGPWCVTILE